MIQTLIKVYACLQLSYCHYTVLYILLVITELSPSPAGGIRLCPSTQKLEWETEVQVKELQRAVEKSFTGSVFKSSSFPSFNRHHGITFQIHLYPVSLRSTSSCAVYLVISGWNQRSQRLPKFDINVSI